MLRLFAVALSLLVSPAFAGSPCDYLIATGAATPWSCHGQSTIPYPANQIINPSPNSGISEGDTGCVGWNATTPYIVPIGYTLIVKPPVFEGTRFIQSGFLCINGPCSSNAQDLLSITSLQNTTPPTPDIYWLEPAGTQVSMLFATTQNSAGWIYAWEVNGCLWPGSH